MTTPGTATPLLSRERRLRPAKPVENRPRPLRFYVLPAAALFVFIEAFPLLSPILFSLLLILLISLAVNPLVFRIRALTGKRAVAAALVVAIFVVVTFLTGWAFFRPVKSSAGKLSERLPAYWERLQKPLIKLEQQARLSEEKLQAEIADETAGEKPAPDPKSPPPNKSPGPATTKPPNQASFIRSGLGQMFQAAAGRFTALAFNATQILVVLITVFFGVTFTLMNPLPVFGAIFSIVPEAHHDRAAAILQRIGMFMPDWARATLLAMLAVGSLVFFAMWPLFGFFDAAVLGMIAGVLEAIPYLGPALSAVPALLFALGEGGSTPMWVVIAYCCVQFLENNLIAPLVMAGRMKLHPVAVMFSMLLCVTVFGVLGLIAAAPIVAIVEILHEEIYRRRFLPSVTDADLDRRARSVLHERPAAKP